MSEKKAQIIILGGGFGGMYCALELEKALARGKTDVRYVTDAFEVMRKVNALLAAKQAP